MFDVEKFRKGIEERLAYETAQRAQKGNSEKFNNETDGYIRCLQNILFILPPKEVV